MPASYGRPDRTHPLRSTENFTNAATSSTMLSRLVGAHTTHGVLVRRSLADAALTATPAFWTQEGVA